MSVQFDHRHSQLFSSCSLYVSQDDLKRKKQRSIALQGAKTDCSVYFIVNQHNHCASVEIKVTPFPLEAYPNQLFHYAFACYKTCCEGAHGNDFYQTLQTTAQQVYASSFGLSNWDFSSDHCWKHDGRLPFRQTTTSCSNAAIAHIEALLSRNAPQISSDDPQPGISSGENTPLTLGKRVREALDDDNDSFKRRRATEAVTQSDTDSGERESSCGKLQDVLILARTLDEEDVEHFLQRTLHLECKALQMAYFCSYLSTSLQLVHAKSMGFGPKKTITQFRNLMKDSGLTIGRSTLARRKSEAQMINKIIASMPGSLISSDCLTLLFQVNFYTLVRSAARAELNAQDVEVILTELHKSESFKKQHANKDLIDLFGFFKKRFPTLSTEDVREVLCDCREPTPAASAAALDHPSSDVARTANIEPVRLDYPDPPISLHDKPSYGQQAAGVLQQTPIVELGQQEETSAQLDFITQADIQHLASYGVPRENCWVAEAPELFGVPRENMWSFEDPEVFGVVRENQWSSGTVGVYPDTASILLH